MITAEGMAAVDENMAGATLTSVMTENATSVTVDDDRFEVADGNLKLKDGMSLDFEGDDGGSIDITITATGDGESATHTVTVTINDVQEAPTIDVRDGEEVPQKGVTSSLTIDENATGADIPPLALIHVTDPDAADATTGQAGADLVTLSGGMEDYFEVVLDPENGLWLALKDGVSFNFEEHGGSVMVTVTYTDTGGHSASQDVTVTIMDVNEAPVADADMEVDDAVFAGGEENSITVDLKALFSDPDGDVLTYRLSDNAPDWLELSVTVRGSGDDQTIMGTISGTAPSGSDMSLDGVMIIASDGDGMEAHASFDIIVDAENDAPTRLELRVTEDDGFVVRTDEVDVDESDEGAVLGLLKVTDEDDARHPHGMHTYTFMVDGEADSRFEVDMDGNLKLKDDESLNHEDDDEIVLTVTATDMAVGDDDSDTESVSLEITITVKNVAAADRPVANKKIGDWWVTVDDDLEAEDVRDGDWLSFRLDTTGDDAAFTHEDGDDLTYALLSVVDADGAVVDWLQMSESGLMTNKADMLPDAGVYTVTVTATDEDGDSAQTSFKLAVAISDDPGTGDRDNDTPDIRDVEEFDYQEGAGAQKVASFSVRDDDVAIYPHPYGTLTVTFTAMQEGDGATMDVKNRLKIVEVGRNEDSVHYEIWTKSAAELAVDDKGKALKTPVKPLDFENGDEIDIEVTVVDGADEEDDKVITIDIDDAADEAPMFMHSAIDGATRSALKKTTTVMVDQERALADEDDDGIQVIVVQLSDAWEDADTDDDELDFSIGGKGGLPDWITVYGPDDWEDIYERQRDVDRGDADSSIRDRDIVFAIVIDRSAATGDNESLMSGSFTVTARDGDGNSATETIVISVSDKNVDIAEGDEDDVVAIKGDPSGTAPLTMDVNLSLDPDLGDADDATLVVYTWITISPDAGNAETVQMVSSTPQPLPIASRDGTAIYAVGTKFKATVQYYEIDPETHQIAQSEVYEDESDATVAPEERVTPTTVSFEVVTSGTGVTVDITTTGNASSDTGAAQLQASTNGTSGWINVSRAPADTSGGSAADVALTVDENGDGTGGDGGGLHYRVVYSYTHNGRTVTEHYAVGQLGQLADPISGATTDIIGGEAGTDEPDVGETLRIATAGNDADVQWQYRDSATMPWKDISGATSLTLRVTSDYTGKMLRAKVTYKADDNTATTNVDESEWADWVEYTEVLEVDEVDATNDAPARTGEDSVIEVELGAMVGMNQPTKEVMFDASTLFHDPDGDALTYSMAESTTTPNTNVPLDASASVAAGRVVDLAGGLVWRVHKTEWDADNSEIDTTDDLEQSLVIDSKTGEITYITDRSHTHDGNADDGAGNVLTFTITATDSKTGTTPAAEEVTVRINVAPTAIEITGIDSSGNTPAGPNINNAADTVLSDDKMMPTALTTPDDDAINAAPADDDSDDDLYTVAENVRNQPAVNLATLDVQDENASGASGAGTGHKFGTHTWTVSDDRFAVVRDSDTDGSTWTLQLKRGMSFDYEKDGDKEGTLVVTVTATDGGGLSTTAHFSIQISDVEEETPTPTPRPDPEPETVPGLEDDADDSDEDGPVIPPDDGGMFIDDLLDQFVISIDDIDIA